MNHISQKVCKEFSVTLNRRNKNEMQNKYPFIFNSRSWTIYISISSHVLPR